MKREQRPKRVPLAGPIELDMLLHTDPRKLQIVRKPKPETTKSAPPQPKP